MGWGIVLGVFALACAVCAICLLLSVSPFGWIPHIPYFCGLLMAVCLLALGAVTGVGTIWYAALLRQLPVAFGRKIRCLTAASCDKARYPSVSAAPRLPAVLKCRLRTVLIISVILFVASLVLSFAVSAATAGEMAFWHAWGWFM